MVPTAPATVPQAATPAIPKVIGSHIVMKCFEMFALRGLVEVYELRCLEMEEFVVK